MTKNPQVIIIGLDGATWKLLNPLIRQGELPFLTSIINQGVSGTLQSTIPSISASAWASFQTGTNPGKHGIYHFFHRRQNHLDPPLIDATTINGQKIWEYLNDSQLTTLLVNMPLSYPVKPINGIIISSFLTPQNTPFAYPQHIQQYLINHHYQIDIQTNTPWDAIPHQPLTQSAARHMIAKSKRIYHRRAHIFTQLFHRQSFDFAFLYFKATDTLQHLFWDTKDINKIWQDIDKTLDKTYRACQSNRPQYWFFISDHGFHPIGKYVFATYPWIQKALKISTPASVSSGSIQVLRHIYSKLKTLGLNYQHLPFGQTARDQAIRQLESHTSLIDNNILPTNEGIYFLKHRNSSQIKTLIHSARLLKHKGKPVFSSVNYPHRLYHGPLTSQGPDIVWQINESFRFDLNPLSRQTFYQAPSHLRGEHFSDSKGIIIAHGPRIKPQRNIQAHIMDILPTVLSLYHLPIPDNIDGLPIKSISPVTKIAKASTKSGAIIDDINL